jgi:hypothetical protein
VALLFRCASSRWSSATSTFRLDRQGQLLSPKTLIYYDETVLPFLRWLEAEGMTMTFDVFIDGRSGERAAISPCRRADRSAGK